MGIQVVVSYPQPRNTNLWRILHDIELQTLYGQNLWRPNMPEVHPFFPNHHSEFGEKFQKKVIELNPRIDVNKLAACYTYKRYLTNNQGFGMEDDPRANWFTMKNLEYENPRVEALSTGGSLIEGEESGDNVIVRSLHYADPPPSYAWFQQNPQYFVYAVNVDGLGTPRRFTQGLQLNGEIVPIVHPFFTNRSRYPVLTIPKWKLIRWTEQNPPDPFRVYIK
jgi:hypothetical protein